MLLFVTVEAAAQNLNLTRLNNSEVIATWDVNPDLFELSFFNVTYFIKPEQQEIPIVTVDTTTYQISDLIPGETYTVRVTTFYSEITSNRVFPADTTEGTVTLDKIGTYVTNLPLANRNFYMFSDLYSQLLSPFIYKWHVF